MPETKHPLKVFLCHAHADKPKVRELYRYLRRRGIQPWLDAEDLVGGQNWREEIPKAISASEAIIICLSKNSINKEGFVQAEITFALKKALEIPLGRIFIIPARFEDCEVPHSLEDYHWVDLFEEGGFLRLMKSLKTRATQLERATVQVPQPNESSPNLTSALDETAESEAAEKAAREKAEREATEKAAREVVQRRNDFFNKIGTDFMLRIESGKKFIKSIASSISAFSTKIVASAQKYWILILFLILPIAIYSIWELSPSNMPFFIHPTATLTPTLTLTITPLSAPTKVQTSTPIIVSPTTTFTPTITNTPTPFPAFITDTKSVEMVFIPAGTFIMGYDKGTVAEDPQRERFVDAFYIDKYETTNELYKECVTAGVCEPPHKNNSSTHTDYYGNSQYNNYPVINVDWYMAVTYCSWRDARLPIEPEWEKAARGDDGRIYPWGNQSGYSYANYYNYKEDTTAVGSYETGKSVYGVYDMAGNVREWVGSLFVEYPYKTNDGREDPDANGNRTFRGGAWSSASVTEIRTSYRSGANPSSSYLSLGFRCARSIPEIPIPESISGTVNTDDSINCRMEPNLNGQIVDFIQPNSSVTIFSRLSDSSWLLVKVPDVESCWVSAPLITVTSGNLGDLPVNTVFPTSTITP